MAMPGERERGLRINDPEVVRAEWLERLNALAAQVKVWAEKSRWRTRIVSKPTRDSDLGRFEVPLLLLERDGVEIALNPVSRFVPGADGAVDLYVMPAYDEVAGLYIIDDEWTLYYVSHKVEAFGIRQEEAMPLSESTLTDVLDEMAVHGA